ncbi:hypothetical protein, partial [Methanoregula sp.]|uniref:hypothetical protein n=1 Tax=Methanoregula sp. TaxID=2052170 RepID=UPI003C78355E
SQDLEKIYRLIQKQGVVANYLMILGIFSRVIDENRNSQISGMYDLDNGEIEALAVPLAETIRVRLGTDRDWHSVLRELSFIATRFNQIYPEPKFGLEIIQLVAPAVVSHFNRDVEAREVLSVLPSYFEESELEEFEAFLNKTPSVLNEDENAEIDWDAIYGPLNVVAGTVAAQREQWAKSRSKIYELPSLVPPAGTQSSDGVLYPAGTLSPSSPGFPQMTGYKTFDIAVSPGLTTQVEPPITFSPVPDPVPAGTRIRPFIPVIIGVAVIILFIIGILVVSGTWNPSGATNVTNATNVSAKNITLVKSTATTATKATPTKPPVTPTPSPTPQGYSSADIGNHLIEIAFGPDNNVIQKPAGALLTVTYSGTYTDSDVALLNNFTSQFNDYSSTTKLSENVNFNSGADIWLVFLPVTSLNQISVDNTTTVDEDFQTGTIYFIQTPYYSGVKAGAKTYVNADLTGNVRQRWILRALLYNLGFLGETAKYPDSLFYDGTNNVTQMNTIDLDALQLMYGRKIANGMTKANVRTTI